jgi:hypothetical protein
MADEIIVETTSAEVIEVGVPGPQGPAGAAGTGLETLTTQGDTLYRGASTGQRLPIGTTGQILRVSDSGLPEWGAAPASGVSSVNGETGAVVLGAADVGADSITQVTISSGTTYAAASARRLRVIVDRPNVNSNLSITLHTSTAQNGDSVEIVVLEMSDTRKVVVSTSGFGDFDVFESQRAIFVYSANMGPARWIKSVSNIYRTPPALPSSEGLDGEIAADANYVYFHVNNVWRRVPVANWS